ncbi:MAG TPA: hypothetical protein QF700_03500 [Prochlorococcus sp.]|nr:hypothetical protein [Prochlorococcus sp.]
MSRLIGSQVHEDAIQLLLNLPNLISQLPSAQGALDQLSAGHPEYKFDLIYIPRSDGHYLDYELLISSGSGLVIKVAAAQESGLPWAHITAEPSYADLLVSVNDSKLSIHSSLLYLDSLIKDPSNGFSRSLEKRLLIQAEFKDLELHVEEAQVESAELQFRRHNGLLSKESMLQWLGSKGMTYDDFQDLMKLNVRICLFREYICKRERAAWLQQHPLLKRFFVVLARVPDSECIDSVALSGMLEVENNASSLSIPKFTEEGIKAMRNGIHFENFCIFEDALKQRMLSDPDLLQSALNSPENHWIPIKADTLNHSNWLTLFSIEICNIDDDIDWEIDNLVFDDWLERRLSEASVRWHWI